MHDDRPIEHELEDSPLDALLVSQNQALADPGSFPASISMFEKDHHKGSSRIEQSGINSHSLLEDCPADPTIVVAGLPVPEEALSYDDGDCIHYSPVDADPPDEKIESVTECACDVISPRFKSGSGSEDEGRKVERVPQVSVTADKDALTEALLTLSRTLAIKSGASAATQPARLTAQEIMRALRGDCSLIEIMASQRRLDARDAAGATLLHMAARRGHLDLYSGLIAAGAEVQLRDQAGRRADELLTAENAAIVAAQSSTALASPDLHAEPKVSAGQVESSFAISDAGEALFDLTWDTPGDAVIFDTQESVSEFNLQAGFIQTRAEFKQVGGVERLDGEDGGNFIIADDFTSSPITGNGLKNLGALRSDADLERARSSTFLSVPQRRRALPARAATTYGYHLPISNCQVWLKSVIDSGVCEEGDVDDLVSQCRGDFSVRDVRANLTRVLELAGIIKAPDDRLDDFVNLECTSPLEAAEISDALSAAATRTSRVPGDDAVYLSRRREQALFRELHDARRLLVRILLELPEVYPIAQRVLADNPAQDKVTETSAEDEGYAAPSESNEACEWAFTETDSAGLKALHDSQFELPQLDAIVEQLGVSTMPAQGLEAHRRLRHAFDQLVILHLPLARRFAVRRTPHGEDVEDFFQECVPALQRAVWKFDPERGYRLQTYAAFWMRQILLRSQQNFGSLVRVPVHRHELLGRLDRLDAERDRLALPKLSTAEAANLLQVDERVIDQLRAIPRVSLPLDESCIVDDASDGLEKVHASQRSEFLSSLLDTLDERQKDILRRRFGLYDDAPQTLEEIGDHYGVTRERIRQIEAKALLRLGHPTRLKALREFL